MSEEEITKTSALRDNDTGAVKLEFTGLQGDNNFKSVWVNLVLSRDSTGTSLFYSGEHKHRSNYETLPFAIDENGLWLCADQDSVGGGWSAGQHLYGSFDDVRFYDRALSADEIELLYRAESPNHFVGSAKDLK